MPKVNVYLPDELAAAVREANIPVSAVCQAALERAVREMTAARSADDPAGPLPNVGLYSRFTPRARTVVAYATQSAQEVKHAEVGTEHVLLGILQEGGNVGVQVLGDLDIDGDDLKAEIVASMEPGVPNPPVGHVPFAGVSKQALEQATKEAVGLGHNYIGCEHLLLGVLAVEDGLGSKVLRRMGVELRTTRRAVTAAIQALVLSPKPQKPATAEPTPSAATLEQILARLDAIERRLGE